MDTTTNLSAGQAVLPDSLKTMLPVSPIWIVVFGILLVALGVFAFISIVTATIVSVYFVALSMMAAGAAEITLGLQSGTSRRRMTWVLIGALYVVAGLFAFFNPVLAAGVLTLMLGTSLVGAGLVRLFLSFQMRADDQWWWVALSAAITILLGLMVLSQWPASSLYILGVFLSVDLLMAGMGWLMIGASAMFSNKGTTAPAP